MSILSAVSVLDFDSLEDIALDEGVDVVAVVQDYVVTIVLYFLVENGLLDRMVFKGGTAIKKVYFPDARFSVDLDFDVVSNVNEGFEKAFEEKLRSLVNSVLGSIYFYDVEKITTSSWLFFNVRYRVFDIDELTRIDIDLAAPSELGVPRRVFSRPYVNAEFNVNAYLVERILEKKVVALLDRNTAKDLWDIYFLHVIKGVEPESRISGVVDRYNREYNQNFDLRKALFVVEEIISERDFHVLSEMYIPENIRADFDTVKHGVAKFIREYWD
mgnify:CR=1 FL=1